MRHSFIDRFSDRKSFLHSLDPRVKFIIAIIIILNIITTGNNDYISFLIYFFIIIILILISNVPLGYIFSRSLVIIPFVLLISIFNIFFREDGIIIFYNIAIRTFLSILSMILLSSTTDFVSLLKGLERMKIPDIFIQMLSFMFRYLFVIMDEMLKLKMARDTRYFGGRIINQIKVFGNIIGVLFIRSYERAERIYNSMLARGFNGEIITMNELRFSKRDYISLILSISVLICVRLWRIKLL